AELLLTGPDAYLAHHAEDAPTANRAYLTSWALAYYLTFERRGIGTDAVPGYPVAGDSRGDPPAAVLKLVNQDRPAAEAIDLPAFEEAWHNFLSRLQSDGTVLEKK